MSKHTPDTATVIDCFLDGAEGNFLREDFDSWLESVKQEAMTKVLREAANIISGNRPLPVGYGDTKTLARDSRTTVAEWLELNADGIEAGGIDNIEEDA